MPARYFWVCAPGPVKYWTVRRPIAAAEKDGNGADGEPDENHTAQRRWIGGLGVTTPTGPEMDYREDPVEYVAREIQLRGMTGPAVMFLEASRPYCALGSQAMLFFDPVLRGLFGGESLAMQRVLADEAGIERLIERLEEIDEEQGWDA
jgi:hypothetical protein